MNIELKEDFKIVEEGATYTLPRYIVAENGLKELDTDFLINFVRGSKLKDEDVPKREGIRHQNLLAMMIHDLKFKNNLVPSKEGSLVITKLEEALDWLRQKQIDRTKKEVEGTYKK